MRRHVKFRGPTWGPSLSFLVPWIVHGAGPAVGFVTIAVGGELVGRLRLAVQKLSAGLGDTVWSPSS